MNWLSMRWSIAIGLAFSHLLSAKCVFADETLISKAAILQRIGDLQVIEAKYDCHVHFTPDMELIHRLVGKDAESESGVRDWRQTFSRNKTSSDFTREFVGGAPDDQAKAEPYFIEDRFESDRVEHQTRIRANSNVSGIIADTDPFPPYTTIDMPLGLRLANTKVWVGAKDCPELQITAAGPRAASASCTDPDGERKHTWNFELVENSKILLRSYDVYLEGHIIQEYKCDDFREVHGLMLPFSITFSQSYWYEGKQTVNEADSLKVKEYAFDAIKDSHILWPLNSSVLDSRSEHEFDVTSTTRPLDDDFLFQALKKKDDAKKATPNAP